MNNYTNPNYKGIHNNNLPLYIPHCQSNNIQPTINNTPQQIPNISENNTYRNFSSQLNINYNKLQCENCFKYGHTKEVWHGNNYAPVTCQLCNKIGHFASFLNASYISNS